MHDAERRDDRVDAGAEPRDATGNDANAAVCVEAVPITPADLVPKFRVWVSDDRMAVLVDCPDPHRDLTDAHARTVAEFDVLGLPGAPAAAAFAELVSAACIPGEHVRALEIATGTEPQPGEDGQLEWTDDFFASGFEVDAETGAVDYWARVDRRSVQEGQLLARLLPPHPGSDGRDVFGNAVRAPEPARARLRAGKNVRVEEDTGGVQNYYAEVDGRLRYKDDAVTVDHVYVIHGNVSLETGHVRHAGSLTVEGDVETGARLEVKGEIVVRGMLEPCTVRSASNLTVGGGVVGNPDHDIQVGGHVQARYIHDATITAGGDIEVTNEIRHARIRTAGRVVAANGRIAGGTTIAHQGITVARAGAEGASSTELIAGVDPFLPERLETLDAQLAKLEAARLKIRDVLARTARRGDHVTEREQAIARDLQQKLVRIEEAAAQTTRTILRARRHSESASRPTITILREVSANCVLGIGEARLRVVQTVAKPRKAEFKDGQVRLLPLGEGNMPDPT